MSKLSRILTGASAGLAVLGVVAATAAPSYAATTGWHQVVVNSATEIELDGSLSATVTLAPSPSDTVAKTSAAGALSIDANIGWKLQWQAVTGGDGVNTPGTSTTGAPGTNLGTTGFAATGGYSYTNGTAATNGNNWGVTFASTNATAANTALTTGLTNVFTGDATNNSSVTPTYSAFTDGTVASGVKYYGVIYYVLSSS